MGLDEFDPEIAQSIKDETDRENNTLEMIASENFVSREVQEAQGSVMTNKSVSYTHLTLPTNREV